MRVLMAILTLAGQVVAQSRPDSAAAHAAYIEGKAALNARRIDRAVEQLERAVELDPSKWEYHMWLGTAYTFHVNNVSFVKKMGVGRRMRAEFDKAVELAPTNAEAGEARLGFYLNAPGVVGGGMDKAEAEARRIAAFDPYRGGLATARVAERAKNSVRAESEYRALMQGYPDSSAPVSLFASFLHSSGRTADAFSLLDARLGKNPNDTTSLYQLGRVASLSGQQLQRGEQALRRFLSLLGVQAPARRANGHYWLGTIREKLGDSTSAVAEYRLAVEVYPAHDAAANALKKLERKR